MPASALNNVTDASINATKMMVSARVCWRIRHRRSRDRLGGPGGGLLIDPGAVLCNSTIDFSEVRTRNGWAVRVPCSPLAVSGSGLAGGSGLEGDGWGLKKAVPAKPGG